MVYWCVVYADQSRSLQHKEPYYSTAKHNTWILNFFIFSQKKGTPTLSLDLIYIW